MIQPNPNIGSNISQTSPIISKTSPVTQKETQVSQAEKLVQDATKGVLQNEPTSPLPLKGRVSADKDPVLKARDSNLYECIGREKGQNGGYNYIFKLRPEYLDEHSAETRNKEIYPAVEPTKMELGMLFEFNESEKEFYTNLGFSKTENPEGIFIKIPDREAVLGSWKVEQGKRPEKIENFILDLKQVHQEKEQFVNWIRDDFTTFFRGEYEKELKSKGTEHPYSGEERCKDFIRQKWGDEHVETIYKDFKEIFSDVKGMQSRGRTRNPPDVWTMLKEDGISYRFREIADKTFIPQRAQQLEKKYGWIHNTVIESAIKNPINEDKLRQHMQLADINLGEGEGIVDDLSFVKTILTFDSILSTNEMIHDMFIHVMKAIELKYIVQNDSDVKAREANKQWISECFEKIQYAIANNIVPLEDIEKVTLALGIGTDGYAADPDPKLNSGNMIDKAWSSEEQSPQNYKIWNDRYPNEKIDVAHLKDAWAKISIAYDKFHAKA